jgi:2-keto-4-pentenoate hydratase/2-oxohepta-3-ene-1,7-dioic acid hydratase in catechol pathway
LIDFNIMKPKERNMRFASFVHAGQKSYGVIVPGDRILDLPATGAALPPDFLGLVAAGPSALATVRALVEAGKSSYALADVRLTAPIPRPTKNVFCVGRNYLDHVAEGYRARGTETKLPEAPQFFTKPPTAVIGPGEPFALDEAVSRKMDYEVELALIIGTAGRDIPAGRAWDHVFGVTILNDITARDL